MACGFDIDIKPRLSIK